MIDMTLEETKETIHQFAIERTSDRVDMNPDNEFHPFVIEINDIDYHIYRYSHYKHTLEEFIDKGSICINDEQINERINQFNNLPGYHTVGKNRYVKTTVKKLLEYNDLSAITDVNELYSEE